MVDLFLSYNRVDQESVLEVRQMLEKLGIRTFLDQDQLIAGLPWPERLEEGLRGASAVAIFLGGHGMGAWQKREMYYALALQVQGEREGRSFPVIPVLLRDAEPMSGFLFQNSWIDLREGISEDALADFVKAVRSGKGFGRVVRPVLSICPYLGLRAFQEEHAAFYFGRERSTHELFERVHQRNLVAVVGPSGSGKSSAVMAGLLPMLRRQRPPNPTWDAVIFTPGAWPWRSLADAMIPMLPEEDPSVLAKALSSNHGALQSAIKRALKTSHGTDRLLMVIDQFEELFTFAEEETRKSLMNTLIEASKASPVTILMTLGSEYYSRAIETSRELSDALTTGQIIVGPMDTNQLRDSIEKPAQVAGLEFEPGLVDVILSDVEAQPGNLALLEYALTELWNLRDGRRLTHGAYREGGGVSGSIGNRAEKVYGGLSDKGRKAARTLFKRLVRVYDAHDAGPDTRYRAGRGQLSAEEWKVAETFSDSRTRLLVTSSDPNSGEEQVELAHDALLRNWNRMREWVDDDRKFLLWRQELTPLLTRWSATDGKDKGVLLRGSLLEDAKRWLQQRPQELNHDETTFIQYSTRVQHLRKSVGVWLSRVSIIVVVLVLVNLAFINSDGHQIRQIVTDAPVSQVILAADNSAALEYLSARAIAGNWRESVQVAQAIPEPYRRFRALLYLAESLQAARKSDDAVQVLVRASECIRLIEKPTDAARALAYLAEVNAHVGDEKRAHDYALQVSDPYFRCSALAEIAETLESAGKHEEAAKIWEDSENSAFETKNPHPCTLVEGRFSSAT